MKKLIAYHNDPKIKESILAQLQAHYDADELVKGKYWEDGKGCAVGCTIYSSNHQEYENRFGISEILARLEDRFFEGLPNALSKEWPLKFMRSINVGVDLSKVWPKFAIFLLADEAHGVIKHARTGEQKEAIMNVATLYSKSLIHDIDHKTWINAYTQARSAAYAAAAAAAVDAAYAAAYAAYAAAYAADADAAYAAYAAAYAADADASDADADAAAYAAAYAAYAAYAADDADDARQNHYIVMSEKLLDIIKECGAKDNE